MIKEKQRKGFAITAAEDPEKHRELASKGGISVHKLGRAYKWDSASARIAGRKGGLVNGERKRRRRNNES